VVFRFAAPLTKVRERRVGSSLSLACTGDATTTFNGPKRAARLIICRVECRVELLRCFYCYKESAPG
jgi:hypothetical protein